MMRVNDDNLMYLPSVIGIGVGAADENAADAVIVVYVDRATGVRSPVPPNLDGVGLKLLQPA
jgi:hypothetical protein